MDSNRRLNSSQLFVFIAIVIIFAILLTNTIILSLTAMRISDLQDGFQSTVTVTDTTEHEKSNNAKFWSRKKFNYTPETLWHDIDELIANDDFNTATALVLSVDVDKQTSIDDSIRFVGISSGYGATLPGIEIDYDKEKDIIIPKSSFDSSSLIWIDFAEIFAEKYNRKKLETLEFD